LSRWPCGRCGLNERDPDIRDVAQLATEQSSYSNSVFPTGYEPGASLKRKY
jgi:hypothetical protein